MSPPSPCSLKCDQAAHRLLSSLGRSHCGWWNFPSHRTRCTLQASLMCWLMNFRGYMPLEAPATYPRIGTGHSSMRRWLLLHLGPLLGIGRTRTDPPRYGRYFGVSPKLYYGSLSVCGKFGNYTDTMACGLLLLCWRLLSLHYIYDGTRQLRLWFHLFFEYAAEIVR